MTTKSSGKNILLKMHPVHRVAISLLVAFATYLFTRNYDMALVLRLMLLWNVFALVNIILSWIVIFLRPASEIKQVATAEDGSKLFVFVSILVSAFASMFTVLLLMLSKETAKAAEAVYLPVAIGGMLLSWFMVHTTFTFHYAHLYYNDEIKDVKQNVGGLEFPGEKQPDYLDFAYFSFVIGMTFQVSDVEISSRIIRRLALLHGLLSFGLNAFVVALTINIIAGLKS